MLFEEPGRKESILLNAYRKNIPIFSPALCDSAIGFSIMFANRRGGRKILIDNIKDIDESSRITEKTKKSSVIYIGGGVPKNFIQQTAIIAGYQTGMEKNHNYAIQITTDMPMWGGLSGCTLEEGQSWGKINSEAKIINCYVDATIALPFIVHALSELDDSHRNPPIFKWEKDNLSINF